MHRDGTPDIRCPKCNAHASEAISYGYQPIELQHAPDGDCLNVWLVNQQRYKCCCGHVYCDILTFKHPCHRISVGLYSYIVRLINMQVAENVISGLTGANRRTVASIHNAMLCDTYTIPSLEGVTAIGIDEHSRRKGQSYLTSIFNLHTMQMLYACTGRRQSDIEPFFRRLKEENLAEQIEVFSCDCSAGFTSMAVRYLPKAKISVDEFHVLQIFFKFMRSVCKAVKNTMARELRMLDKRRRRRARKNIGLPDVVPEYYENIDMKAVEECLNRVHLGLKWIKENAREEVVMVVERFPDIALLAELMDDCRRLWHDNLTPEDSSRLIDEIIAKARLFPHEAMHDLADFLQRRRRHLIHAATFGVSNSPVEEMNSAAKGYQRAIRGVKNVAQYIMTLHIMFSKPRKTKFNPEIIPVTDFLS